MDYLSKLVVSYLLKTETIASNEQDLYFYGVVQLFQYVIFIVASALLGLFFNRLLELGAFLLFFSLLRSAVGGIHLPNKKLCLLSTIFLILIFLVFINFNSIQNKYLYISIILGHSLFLLRIPLQNHKKKIYEPHILNYFQRRRNRIIIGFSILSVAFNIFNLSFLSNTLLFVFFINSLSLLLLRYVKK